jgi:hypothetical protein
LLEALQIFGIDSLVTTSYRLIWGIANSLYRFLAIDMFRCSDVKQFLLHDTSCNKLGLEVFTSAMCILV